MVGRGELREPVRRLLLVEDDPGDAFLVGELIAEVDPDLALTVAGSMPEALPAARRHPTACCSTSTSPATRASTGCARCSRADPLAAVCVLTGLDDEHLGTDAVAAGAQDYLVKGKVDGPLLIRAIRYAVERRRAETSLLRLREEQLVAAESSAAGTRAAALAAARGQRRAPRHVLPRGPHPRGAGRRLLRRRPRRRRHRARDHRRRLRPRTRRGRARRAPAGVVARARAGRGGRGAAAAGAAAAAGQRAPRQQAVHDGVHDHDLRRHRRRAAGRAPAAGGALVGRRRSRRRSGCRLGSGRARSGPRRPSHCHPSWALLLYTDGLIEAREPASGDFLWIDGLLELLSADRDTVHAELPARLVERAEAYNGGPLLDDVAILLLVGP